MQSHHFSLLERVIDRQPLTVSSQTPLIEVIGLMQIRGNRCRVDDSDEATHSNSSCVLIVEDRQLQGIFTERDLVRLIAAGTDCDRLSVVEVMSRELITLTLTENQDIFTALNLLRQHSIRHLPIVDARGNVLGLITTKNLRQKLQPFNLMRWHKVAEVMETGTISANPDDSIRQIAQLMANHKISCVAIAESEGDSDNPLLRPVGIITERDIVQYQNLNLDWVQPARNLMSAPLFLVSPEDSLLSVHQQMQQRRVRRLVVTGERGELVGIITQTTMLQMFDPAEMYAALSMLQQQVRQLESDRNQLLENRQVELEREIQQRTAALEGSYQRLQYEVNLRQQEQRRFYDIFNSLEDVVWSVDPQSFATLYINEAAERIYGRRVAEFYDNPHIWLEVIHPEDRERVEQRARKILELENCELEYRIALPDATVRWLNNRIRVINDPQGLPIRIDSISRDISDRVSTEAALRESEQRFRNMADNAPVIVWVTDENAYCTYVSQSWCEFTGQTKETASGLGWLDAVHPDDHAAAQTIFLRANERQSAFRLEYRLRRHNGEYRWAIDAAKPWIDNDGQFKGYIGSVIDISDRVSAELEIRKFVSLADNSSEFIGMCDLNFVPFYLNPAGKQLVGLDNIDNYNEVSIGDFFFPEDRDFIFNEFFPQVLRQGQAEVEIRFRHFQTGDAIWMIYNVHSIEDDRDRPIALATLSRDISDRKHREEILKDIASGVSVETGENFLPSLCQYLSKTLKVDYAFISRIIESPTDIAETLAVYGRGQAIDNFEYHLANSPCDDVIARGLCIYPQAVRQLFPNNPTLENMQAESYAGMPILNNAGQVFGLISVVDRQSFDDVALIEEVLKIFAARATSELERQQAETKIKEQAALLNLTHDTIIVRNLDNTIAFWNRGAETMYGWTEREALGQNSHQLLQAQFDRPLAAIESELIREGHWEGEIVHHKKDGTKVIVMGRWSLLTDGTTNPTQILEINHDITQRKQAEAKIKEQAALLDIATDAIMVRGLDDKILYWNRGAEKIYGWTKAEALDKNGYELLYREYPTQLRQIQQAVTEQGEWQGEFNQVTKAGQDIVVQSRWTLVRDEAGNPSSYLVVKSDITEQKQLQTQFLRAQRLESLGTLASGIAHDLNNIFSPILGFSRLLPLKLPNLDKSTKSYFQIMENNAQRGTALVKQILTFARGMEGEKGVVQIRHLIDEIGQIIRETFPKTIELELNAPKNLWTVNADLNQLHQVLMNLAVNARDAMPHGGKLKIAAENFPINANFAQQYLDAQVGSYILITVSDTGVGIPPEIIDRIFEPFFTTKEIGHGTGLGLSTTIGIIKNHGGFVDVVSDRRRNSSGTQFKLFLPACQSKATDTEAAETIPEGKGELILVVDDETSILSATQAILETYNYRVLTATNGMEAIATYAHNLNAIDVVITDLMMPTMDGQTAIRTLKQIDPEIKIIAVSGLISAREKLAELDNQITAFISKPYSNEELLKTIRTAISVN